MLQRITSLIVIGAALFQVTGFAALRRYFVDLEIFAPSALANIGAVADWGYQVILASPNIVAIALLFVARIALTDSVIRPYTTQPLELVFISDGPANYRDAAATWYSRFAWGTLLDTQHSASLCCSYCTLFGGIDDLGRELC